MAINDAFSILQNQLKGIKNENTIRKINYDSTELKKNVVLITVESLSAEFMTSFGNEKHITPLDLFVCDKCLFARQKIMGKIGYQSKST